MRGKIITADLKVIDRILRQVLGSSDYIDVERMGGLTNRTYKTVFSDGRQMVVRIPGEGTEELIVRADEKVSTELAWKLGIDGELLYFGEDGIKVTCCIPDAVTMSDEKMREAEHIRQAAAVLHKLHSCGADTKVLFEVFEMAQGYEKIIERNHVAMYPDYDLVKSKVLKIKKEIDAVCGIHKVPCHNDPLCENWILSGSGELYLIDWEYAGMNDGIWDLADISIEAGYSPKLDELILTEYLGSTPTQTDWKHFLANKLYVDYLWTLWAKARVPYDGQSMENWAFERYERLKKNIAVFEKI